MFLKEVYSTFLRLYPADFRAEFGSEMSSVFEQAATQRMKHNSSTLPLFVVREMIALVAGAVKARAFRPGSKRLNEHPPFPTDITSAERYIEIASKRVIRAIATHDFVNARYYHQQDQRARALLEQLRAQPG